ncbi:uncharacterized protein N7484_000480 [Penicillium longicatenatum]|uniref:uncharacterized protein n=1 Tax=Penicillium longicatenatum TaxID=1561947 RepID=UPI0025476D6D|nr:uncharacterized protein N7484_000480 [Penicillium longicatenatum]KAJ5661108.1 hypothetical protein N7484_000480 [Penicillium longicatenatum]
MADDIDSNIYYLKQEGYPLTEQTLEAPPAAPIVNAEEPQPPKQKKPRRRKDDPEPEYSEQVRSEQIRKKVKSERSRHACDRCKIKKTRCLVLNDSQACFPCLQDDLDCFVTDRVTNQTFKLGEAGRMRDRIAELEEKVTELEEKIVELEIGLNTSEFIAKINCLEEENAALLSENLRWREGLRFLNDSWEGIGTDSFH